MVVQEDGGVYDKCLSYCHRTDTFLMFNANECNSYLYDATQAAESRRGKLAVLAPYIRQYYWYSASVLSSRIDVHQEPPDTCTM